jgi:hypothetical protein
MMRIKETDLINRSIKFLAENGARLDRSPYHQRAALFPPVVLLTVAGEVQVAKARSVILVLF